MRCEEVQDLASAWLDNEVSESDARAVAEHVAGCETCRAIIADMRLMSRGMARLGREPAPPGFEQRIRITLAGERGGDAGRAFAPFRAQSRFAGFARQAASMAAVCLLSVFGTWAVMQQQGAALSAEHDVVAAHVRSLLQDSPIQVPSSDAHTVRPWFNGKVEFAPPVKDLAAEGFPLVGGRLDYVDGHRVATLVYRRRLHTVSVFVWPEGAAAHAGKPKPRVEGLNVLTWSKDGMVWWAVSDLDPGELRELRTLL
jgi:anti-sigma factor RsiW